jgi:hypothetical protein
MVNSHIYTGRFTTKYGVVVNFSKHDWFDAYRYGVEKNKESVEWWKLKAWEFDGEHWKLLRETVLHPLLQPQETNPTWENVLDYFNIEFSHKKPLLEKTKERHFKDGYIVAVPGLSPCPWCASEMEETGFRAVCKKNPLHKAIWLPWGG